MRPQPSERVQPPVVAARVSAGSVAEGGVVADWQRMIETRFADLATFDQPSRAERLMGHASRLTGIAALAAGYAAIAWFCFG